MLAQGVESERLHIQDILFKTLRCCRCVQAVTPVTLVQQTMKEIGFPIQAESRDPIHGFRSQSSQRKIRMDPVKPRSQGEGIKEWILRAPGVWRINGDAHHSVMKRKIPAVQGNNTRRDPFCADFNPVRATGNLKCTDISFRHRLQPDGLPDTGTGRIPHSTSLFALLAPGKTRIQIVAHPDAELIIVRQENL